MSEITDVRLQAKPALYKGNFQQLYNHLILGMIEQHNYSKNLHLIPAPKVMSAAG